MNTLSREEWWGHHYSRESLLRQEISRERAFGGPCETVLSTCFRSPQARHCLDEALSVAEEHGDVDYASQAREHLDLVEREIAGQLAVNRPPGASTLSTTSNRLERNADVELVETIEDVQFPATRDPAPHVFKVACLARNMAHLFKRDVRTTFTPCHHYVVFGLYNDDVARLTISINFRNSRGIALLGDASPATLVATVVVDPKASSVVAVVRCDKVYGLIFKVKCGPTRVNVAKRAENARPARRSESQLASAALPNSTDASVSSAVSSRSRASRTLNVGAVGL